jgi:hypothetical protein
MSELLPTMIAAEEPKREVNTESEVHHNEEHVDIVEREKVDTDEVFVKKKADKPVILKVSSADEVKDEVVVEEIVQPAKKPKKKRVVTEAQKAHLAKAREKALATRRRNKLLREEEKQADESLINKKKLVRKQIRDEEEKKLDEIINAKKPTPAPAPAPAPTPPPAPAPAPYVSPYKQVSFQFTQQDLDQAVANGIDQYEKVRKARKAEKQKKKEIEAKQKQVYSVVAKAVGHNWDHCFM